MKVLCRLLRLPVSKSGRAMSEQHQRKARVMSVTPEVSSARTACRF